jgi:hypothetical protein
MVRFENGGRAMDDLLFTPSEVARGADIEFALLQSRLQRGHLRVRPEPDAHDLGPVEYAEEDQKSRPSAGKGAKALFSVRRFIQVVIAEELVANGTPVQDAYNLALSFTDIGERNDPATMRPDRAPGELFKDGRTLLIVWREGRAWRREVKQAVTRRFDLEALFGGGRRCVVVLDVGDLIREAMRRIAKPATDRAEAILRAAVGGDDA